MVVVADQDPALLRLCLRALATSLAKLPYSWSVAIVETSGDGHGSSLREALAGATSLLPTATLIFNDSPSRITSAAAMAAGVQWAGEDALQILFVHESVEVDDAVLADLVATLARSPRVGMVAASSMRPDGTAHHQAHRPRSAQGPALPREPEATRVAAAPAARAQQAPTPLSTRRPRPAAQLTLLRGAWPGSCVRTWAAAVHRRGPARRLRLPRELRPRLQQPVGRRGQRRQRGP